MLELTASCHKLRPASAAKVLNVTRSRLTRAILRLELEGLVRFDPDPHDQRTHIVMLTTAGAHRVLGFPGRQHAPVTLESAATSG